MRNEARPERPPNRAERRFDVPAQRRKRREFARMRDREMSSRGLPTPAEPILNYAVAVVEKREKRRRK